MSLHFERSEFDARRDRLMIEMAERKRVSLFVFQNSESVYRTVFDRTTRPLPSVTLMEIVGQLKYVMHVTPLPVMRETSCIRASTPQCDPGVKHSING